MKMTYVSSMVERWLFRSRKGPLTRTKAKDEKRERARQSTRRKRTFASRLEEDVRLSSTRAGIPGEWKLGCIKSGRPAGDTEESRFSI